MNKFIELDHKGERISYNVDSIYSVFLWPEEPGVEGVISISFKIGLDTRTLSFDTFKKAEDKYVEIMGVLNG